jgi:hypothetical protein
LRINGFPGISFAINNRFRNACFLHSFAFVYITTAARKTVPTFYYHNFLVWFAVLIFARVANTLILDFVVAVVSDETVFRALDALCFCATFIVLRNGDVVFGADIGQLAPVSIADTLILDQTFMKIHTFTCAL